VFVVAHADSLDWDALSATSSTATNPDRDGRIIALEQKLTVAARPMGFRGNVRRRSTRRLLKKWGLACGAGGAARRDFGG
jgi:hypothetical protein